MGRAIGCERPVCGAGGSTTQVAFALRMRAGWIIRFCVSRAKMKMSAGGKEGGNLAGEPADPLISTTRQAGGQRIRQAIFIRNAQFNRLVWYMYEAGSRTAGGSAEAIGCYGSPPPFLLCGRVKL